MYRRDWFPIREACEHVQTFLNVEKWRGGIVNPLRKSSCTSAAFWALEMPSFTQGCALARLDLNPHFTASSLHFGKFVSHLSIFLYKTSTIMFKSADYPPEYISSNIQTHPPIGTSSPHPHPTNPLCSTLIKHPKRPTPPPPSLAKRRHVRMGRLHPVLRRGRNRMARGKIALEQG